MSNQYCTIKATITARSDSLKAVTFQSKNGQDYTVTAFGFFKTTDLPEWAKVGQAVKVYMRKTGNRWAVLAVDPLVEEQV